jgi:predicted RNase H-like HicB family nuclease
VTLPRPSQLNAVFDGPHSGLVLYGQDGGGCMKYKVVLQHSDEGVSASVPGLPGCWSQGANDQDALDNIRSAIQEYLAVVAEQTKGADVREVEVTV